MKIICRKRGRGKTLKLIQKCVEMNRTPNNLTYILVANNRHANWLFQFAKNKNYVIPFPITVHEILSPNMRGTFIKNLLVDDIDEVLKEFCTGRFNVMLGTVRSEVLVNDKRRD